jgi:hypothetical protein
LKRTIALCACLLAVNVAAKAGDVAQALPPPAVYPSAAYPPTKAWLPPHEIAAIVRSIGLKPVHRPARHGATYLVRAVGPSGEEVKVVLDARIGIVRIDPVLMTRYGVPVARAHYGLPPGVVPRPERRPMYAELPPGAAPGLPPVGWRAPIANRGPAVPPQAEPGPLPRPRPKVTATEPAKHGGEPSSPATSAQSPSSDTSAGAASTSETTGSASPPPASAEQQEE